MLFATQIRYRMSEMTPAMHHAITHPDESAIRAKMKKTTAGTSGITNTITNQKTAMIAKVLSNSFRQPPFSSAPGRAAGQEPVLAPASEQARAAGQVSAQAWLA